MDKERVPWSEEKRAYFREYHRVRREAIKAGTWAYRHRKIEPPIPQPEVPEVVPIPSE